MNTPDEAPPVVFREPYVVQAEYDLEKGQLSFIDEQVTRVLETRAGFEEIATRRAAIIELERLGYTVTPPTTEEQK